MVRFTIAVFLGLSLASCNNKLAEKCAEVYPCKDSITYVGIGITDSIPYIVMDTLWKDSIVKDRVYVWTDMGTPKEKEYVLKPVIKYKYITRQGVEKVVRVRDTAKEKVLQNEIEKLQKQLQKSESQTRIKIPWWVAIFIALFGYGLYKTTKK